VSDRKLFLGALASLALSACATSKHAPVPTGTFASPLSIPSSELAPFMALSAILTGYSDLDPTIGSVYLNGIRSDTQRAEALNSLYAGAGFASGSPSSSLADLERRGVFTDPASLSIATQILGEWYSGIYQTTGGPTTATWTQALAWRACSYTKPPSLCTVPGSWSKAPAT